MKLSKLLMAAGFFVLPMFTLNLQAQQSTAVWNPPGGSDGLWTTVANWVNSTNATINVLPGPGVKAADNVTLPCVVNTTVGGGQVVIGDGADGAVIVVTNGGNLTCGDASLGNLDDYGWTGIGYSHASTMIVESGASVTFNYHVWLGLNAGGNGTLILNGGTATIVNANAQFGIGTSGGAGIVHLYGGTLTIYNAHLQLPNAGEQINLAGGTLAINQNGNVTDTWDPFISAGQIVGYGGTGTVHVDTTSEPGFTLLTGVGGSTPPSGSQITFTSVHSGGAVTIIYNSTVSAPYHIESTASLSPPSWAMVSGSSTNATATSTSFSFTDPSNKDYYRVVSP